MATLPINPETGETYTPLAVNEETGDLYVPLTQKDSDDDKGTIYYENDGSSSSTASPKGVTPNTNTGQPKSNSGETIAGKAGASNTGSASDLLGRRTFNPLSDFSSTTYKISLYYMDPLQFNDYVDGNRAAIKDFKLIAQSGGATQGQDTRAPGFDLDFYIDDLEIVTLTNSKETQAMSNSTTFKFKIYEPYGFTFTKKLANALNLSTPELKNVKGHFLIVFRFYGYDANGKLLHSSDVQGSSVNNSDPQAIFERGFPIVFKKFHFRLDYKTVVYDIEAVQVNEQIAKGVKNGSIPNKCVILGSTVEEILIGNASKKSVTGLTQVLNQNEKSKATGKNPKIEIENKYKIEFVNADEIKNALMVPQDEVIKQGVPMSKGAGEKESYKAKAGTIEKKIRKMELAGGGSILQTIDQIISLSSYVKDALISFDKENEKVQDSDSETFDNPNPKTIAWYNVTSTVKVIGKELDSKRQDYPHEITYTISKYEIPFIRSLYASKTTKYYGPHKRYNYWYTGKNSELISFELDYNYLYFLNVVAHSDAKTSDSNSTPTGSIQTNADPTGAKTGTNDQVGSMKSWLYSPGDQINCKMKIIGDPDYLMPTVAGGKDAVAKRFYGPDFTINPNSGQVFVEVDFKQAEDYDINNGLLGPNDEIVFANYPSELKSKIKGMTFMLTQVTSRFSKGKFEQDLKGILPEFTIVGDKGRDQDKNKTATPTQKTEKGRTTAANKNESVGGGRSSKTFASTDERRFDVIKNASKTVVTNSQGVADDDGSSDAAEMAKLKRQEAMNKPSDGGRMIEKSNNSRNISSSESDYSGDGNVTDFGLG